MLQRLLRRLGRGTLDLVLPLQCVGCRKEGSGLCQVCQSSLARLEPPYCEICAQPDDGPRCSRCVESPPLIDGIKAPYLMEGVIRDAIHAFKYRNFRGLAPELGKVLAECLESTSIPGTLLVPIPMHGRRVRQRGYNQSLLLAREVSKLTSIAVAEDMLIKTRDSAPQVSLATQEERARNAEGSFLAVRESAGEAVLLIDDVVTTGSTMAACAKAAKEKGAASVWGLALAREA